MTAFITAVDVLGLCDKKTKREHRSYSQRLRSYASYNSLSALLRTARPKSRYATLHQLAGDVVNLAPYR